MDEQNAREVAQADKSFEEYREMQARKAEQEAEERARKAEQEAEERRSGLNTLRWEAKRDREISIIWTVGVIFFLLLLGSIFQ